MSTPPPRDDYRGLTAIWALSAQIIMATLGYLGACLAAALFATIAITGLGFEQLIEGEGTTRALVFIVTTFFAVAIAAFFPFLVALVITEAFKLRGFVAHLVAGCLVGLVYGLPVAALFRESQVAAVSVDAVQLGIACGAVGGIVYWLVAGRTAGKWLELPWFEENRR